MTAHARRAVRLDASMRLADGRSVQKDLAALAQQGEAEIEVVEDMLRPCRGRAVVDGVGETDRSAADRRLDAPAQAQDSPSRRACVTSPSQNRTGSSRFPVLAVGGQPRRRERQAAVQRAAVGTGWRTWSRPQVTRKPGEAAIEAACRLRLRRRAAPGCGSPSAPCQASGMPRQPERADVEASGRSAPRSRARRRSRRRAPRTPRSARRRARCGGRSRAGADRRPAAAGPRDPRWPKQRRAAPAGVELDAARTPRRARRWPPSARASAAIAPRPPASDSGCSWPGIASPGRRAGSRSRAARPARSCCTSASARSPAPSAAARPW